MLPQVLMLSAAALLALSPAPLHPQQQQQRELSSRRISGSGSSSSSEEQSGFPQMGVRFQNEVTLKCLTAGTDGKVFSSLCFKRNSETWELIKGSLWRNVATKQCLDMSGNGLVFTTECERVGLQSQNWEHRSDSDHIKNILFRRCINEKARAEFCHKGRNIIWNSI